MTRIWMGLALGFGLSACGGTPPFNGGDETPADGGAGSVVIPDAIANTLESFTYNPDTETLPVRGIAADGSTVESAYRRRPALDRPGLLVVGSEDIKFRGINAEMAQALPQADLARLVAALRPLLG